MTTPDIGNVPIPLAAITSIFDGCVWTKTASVLLSKSFVLVRMESNKSPATLSSSPAAASQTNLEVSDHGVNSLKINRLIS